jgi:hypothetical protein
MNSKTANLFVLAACVFSASANIFNQKMDILQKMMSTQNKPKFDFMSLQDDSSACNSTSPPEIGVPDEAADATWDCYVDDYGIENWNTTLDDGTTVDVSYDGYYTYTWATLTDGTEVFNYIDDQGYGYFEMSTDNGTYYGVEYQGEDTLS